MQPWRERVDSLVDRARPWLEPRPTDPIMVRIARLLMTSEARDRVLIIAGQAFTAVIPLMILLATISPWLHGSSLANGIIARFGLEGEVAEAVTELFARPPGATNGVSVTSLLILIFLTNSFARTIRRTFELTWGLRSRGIRATGGGVGGLMVLLAAMTGMSWLATATDGPLPVRFLVLVLQLAVGTIAWLVALRLFVGREVERAALIPGALFGGVAQVVAGQVSSIYLPIAMAHSTARYGAIGVAFSMVTWMIIIAAVLVGVAVVSAETARSWFAVSLGPNGPVRP